MKPQHNNEVETARQARRSIGLIRQRLLSPTPEVLDACTPHLHTAIDSLDRLQRQLASPESLTAQSRNTLRMEMVELRRELSQVNALMRNASGFYAGLAYLLAPEGADSVIYAASGVVADQPVPTMLLEA